MDSHLIKTINKLQDAFSTVGVQNPIDLPQVITYIYFNSYFLIYIILNILIEWILKLNNYI